MRLRNTFILALIFAGLAAFLYFVEFERAAEEAKKKTLFDLDGDKVTGVTLTYPDRKIVVKKADGKWRLAEPIEDLADETAVENLVRAIAECEIKKTLDDVPADLAPFELDKPKVEILVALADEELPLIRVGKNTPVGFSTYVQRADDPKVHLTTSAFASGMDKQVKDLRDKQILTFSDDSIRRIAVQRGDGRVLLKKTDEAWTIEEPAPYTADATTVRSFLATLRSLRAVDFVAEEAADLAAYGLDAPRVSITLYGDKEDDQKQVLVGGENDKKDVYVKVAGRAAVYTAGSWVFRDLDKTLNDFRDKTIFAFEPDAVTTIKLVHADGEQLSFTRADKDTPWALADHDDPPEASKVAQLLTDLKDLKGFEIATEEPDDLGAWGLAEPELTVSLGSKDGPLASVKFGSHRAEEGTAVDHTALREGEPTVFKLREYVFTRINKRARDFLPKPTVTPTGAGASETSTPDS
jgi:hypothetical protein